MSLRSYISLLEVTFVGINDSMYCSKTDDWQEGETFDRVMVREKDRRSQITNADGNCRECRGTYRS